MASATRYGARRRRATPVMPTRRELDKLRVVLTPAARDVLSDETVVRAAIRDAVPNDNGTLPEEIVLWRGKGDDRVVALINRHVRAIYLERMGMAGSNPRRDAAIKVVDLGIGSRPDLPSGVEYVRKVRGIWRGLLPHERS